MMFGFSVDMAMHKALAQWVILMRVQFYFTDQHNLIIVNK